MPHTRAKRRARERTWPSPRQRHEWFAESMNFELLSCSQCGNLWNADTRHYLWDACPVCGCEAGELLALFA